MPHTLDRAAPFVAGAHVLFGFPDILFTPADAFAQLLARQAETGAEVVLGLFPAHSPEKMDMVAVADGGAVRRIDIKPTRTDLRDTWIIATWTPAFTGFLRAAVERASQPSAQPVEHLGEVLQAAIVDGWAVQSVRFPAGTYRDIGTPEDLAAAVAEWSASS